MASRSKQLISTARAGMPEGTWSVGAGMIVMGFTAYVFQIVCGHALTKSGFAAINGLWVMVFAIGPGLFLPIEQEVGRALSHRRANGTGGGPLVKRAALLGAILLAGVIVVSLLIAPTLIDKIFNGYTILLAALVVGVAGYFCEHLTRGALAGNGRFPPYGRLLGVEGGTRALLCILLAVAGVKAVGWYGAALVIPPFLGVAAALWRQQGLVQPGPPAPYSELSSALGYLLAGSLLAQFLGYASFIGAELLAPSGSDAALAGFIAALFLARIPILLFQAVQAALLPKLAALHGTGRHEDFRTGLHRLVYIVGGIGLLGAVAAFTIGPTVGEKLFPDKWTLGNLQLGLLAVGTAMFILALTVAQAAIALRDYVWMASIWVVGLLGFVATAAIAGAMSTDLYIRMEVAFVVGSALSAILFYWRVHHHIVIGDTADVDPLFAALENERLEL
jgi:O-antigen/teichoic acid export membrane protein